MGHSNDSLSPGPYKHKSGTVTHILITATFTTQKAQGEEKKRSMCIHET
jgi:hypothetical protein